MQDFFLWIGKNGSWFLLLSLAVVLFRWRYLTDYLRYVALFVGLAVLGEATSYITARVLKVPNLYILHFYTIVEFNIIALFYRAFFSRFYPRLLVPGLMIGFTTLAILNSAFLQPLTGYNTYARGLEGLLVIALALLCFYKMLTELTAKRIDRHPVFWINTGFLLYFAGSLFFLILSNILLTNSNRTLILTVFGLHALLMVVMHLLISIGLWLSPRLR
ncbi:hypothetical protein [Spirosoma spitsbergense]|uniref:hypothetical protein n=1 Tax=Spirosoma spitsbergense TaxID=431554 RepID=UPI00037EFE55|nr:hypothetical protein [Spirosoma spitsbergense]